MAQFENPPQEKSIEPVKISELQKNKFLRVFRNTGDLSGAADEAGVGTARMMEELKTNEQFKQDYQQVLLKMKHKIEGIMFTSGTLKAGYKLWLETYFPEQYKVRKAPIKQKREKSAVDQLLEDLT